MSKGNILLSDNVVGDLSTEHSFSIWISKELAMELAPNVRVVVWFATDFGEIVADSTEISINDIFANEVSASLNEASAKLNEVSATLKEVSAPFNEVSAPHNEVIALFW